MTYCCIIEMQPNCHEVPARGRGARGRLPDGEARLFIDLAGDLLRRQPFTTRRSRAVDLLDAARDLLRGEERGALWT